MKRKTFLKRTLPATIFPFVINGLPLSIFWKGCFPKPTLNAASANDRVLVLVQLQGGNDGLNCVIPLDQYSNLTNARKNIIIPDKKVLVLKDTSITGFHPSMSDLQSMYNNKQLTVIQGVGYPNPNYSHFRATDIWLTGSDSDKVISSGWAGRFLEQKYPNYPIGYPNDNSTDPPAIQIGSVLSLALQGSEVGLGISLANTNDFYDLVLDKFECAGDTPASHELDFIRVTARQTKQYTSTIKAAALSQRNLSNRYPSTGMNPLADQLKIVAQLIGGGLKTKVYMVTLDGFDTHAGQVNPDNTLKGKQANLLMQLSEAIAAFEEDLQLIGKHNDVIGMAFSEFGRRIRSNASDGTDHGSSGPVILFGSRLKGGIIGINPPIENNVGPEDNLPMQYDFRSVYASVLQGWFNLTDTELKNSVLSTYPILDLFT